MSILVKASDGYGLYTDEGVLVATWDLSEGYEYILSQTGETTEKDMEGKRPLDMKPKAPKAPKPSA
tara:strand:+ start:361 stop:558 length:198 start_codon:yes stop_codon:yes gene_type:complete